MHRYFLPTLLSLLVFAAPAAAGENEFQSLFNGENLDGWHNPYDHGHAEVVNDEIRLHGNDKWFLVSEKQYGDFVFEAEVKLPDAESNSGLQFRSHVKPNRVWGYQAEVDPSDRAYAGGLYDEGRRGWLNNLAGEKKKQNAWNHGEWNHYKIKAVGDHIQIWVNGVKTTDYRDPVDLKGHLALQHHGEDGKVYRFRNIKVKDLGQHQWVSLFNGENLEGWVPEGGGEWSVEDGIIVGRNPTSDEPQGVLVSEKQYGDVTARITFKTNGNSGFYFHTERVDANVILHGIQAEVEPQFQTGGLYETGGRGWVVQPDTSLVKEHFNPDKWATLTVSAHDNRIVTHVNGARIVETDEPNRTYGYFGLQLHGGQKMTVRFKRVQILEKVE
jgi:hypothetical protein